MELFPVYLSEDLVKTLQPIAEAQDITVTDLVLTEVERIAEGRLYAEEKVKKLEGELKKAQEDISWVKKNMQTRGSIPDHMLK